jgi:hypothetical protein
MNRDSIAATLLLPLLASPAARAQQNCTPIQFPPGQTATTVEGTARTDPPFACYTLATRADQTVSITIVSHSPQDDTACNIEGWSITVTSTASKPRPRPRGSTSISPSRGSRPGRSRCR